MGSRSMRWEYVSCAAGLISLLQGRINTYDARTWLDYFGGGFCYCVLLHDGG